MDDLHPLLINTILDTLFSFFQPSELCVFRFVHTLWSEIAKESVLSHSWLITQRQLKQLHNCDARQDENTIDAVCPIRGCLFKIFNADHEKIQIMISDFSLRYRYSITFYIGIRTHACVKMEKFLVIPKEYCIDNKQHLILSFSVCLCCNDLIFVDYTDFFNIRHFHVPYKHINIRSEQTVSFSQMIFDRFWSLSDVSRIDYLCNDSLSKRCANSPLANFHNKYIQFFKNGSFCAISNYHGNNFETLSFQLFCGYSLIFHFQVDTKCNTLKKALLVCDHYALVITENQAEIYDCLCKKMFFFKTHCSIGIKEVFTLNSDFFLISWEWSSYHPNTETRFGAYLVNTKTRSWFEFSHSETISKLPYIINWRQMNESHFIGVGIDYPTNKFIVTTLDTITKTMILENDQDKLLFQ